MENQKIRIILKSFDPIALYKVSDKLTKMTVLKTGDPVAGPIPMPVRRKKWSIARGPNRHSDSHEQFEIRYHKVFIQVENINNFLIDELNKVNIEPGVGVTVKILS